MMIGRNASDRDRSPDLLLNDTVVFKVPTFKLRPCIQSSEVERTRYCACTSSKS